MGTIDVKPVALLRDIIPALALAKKHPTIKDRIDITRDVYAISTKKKLDIWRATLVPGGDCDEKLGVPDTLYNIPQNTINNTIARRNATNFAPEATVEAKLNTAPIPIMGF